jgi:hypothetical protein
MTHDIRKLITDIRKWERADKAFTVAQKAWYAAADEDDDATYEVRGVALEALRKAAAWYTDKPHDEEKALAAFVALADAYDAQAARIAAALAIETAHPDTISGGLNNVQMAVGWNEARDEFRAALTGNDEGDA